MQNSYSEVYDVLDSFGIRSPQHINKLAKKSGRQNNNSLEIRKALFNGFENLYSSVEQLSMPIRGISLCVDASTKKRIPEILVKKCLVYGETTTFLTNGARKVQGTRKRGHSFSTEYDYIVPISLIDFLLRYRALVEDGIIIPLPKEIKSLTTSIEPLQSDAIESALPVSLKDDALFTQLNESEEVMRPSRAGYSNLLLPSVQNSNIEDIRTLRHELSDSFIAFHRQLKFQLQGASEVSTEHALLELMQQTDEEVRRLHSQINTLKRTRLLKGSTIVSGFTAAAIVALAPVSLSTMVAGLFGSSTALAGMTFLTDFYGKSKDLHQHDFYFPWKIGFGKS